MSWQCHPARRKRKASACTAEKAKEFRIAQLTERCLNAASHRDNLEETACRRISPDRTNGKARPPTMRSKRATNGTAADSTRRCKNGRLDMTPFRPSRDSMARRSNRDTARQKSQQTPAPRPTLDSLLTTQPHPFRPFVTSPQSPALPAFTCPLCRCCSQDNDGSLCNACQAEFSVSCGDFGEDDDAVLLPALPSSSPDACPLSPAVRISTSYYWQDEGQVDLYDLDWAEYYFNKR